MAIVQNANDEHQFLFAVNAISMVKSDALFSYVAPTNVIAWLLTPLRFVFPFRQFVRLNRTVIKVTHFPVLLMIYTYERVFLRKAAFDPAEMVEQRGRPLLKGGAFDSPGMRLFSPQHGRLREPSVATHQKDRALDEVFRRPFRGSTFRGTQKSHERRQTSNVVNSWMSTMGPNGRGPPPDEQDRAVLDRLEARRVAHRQSLLEMRRRQRPSRLRDFTQATMSIASDPEDLGVNERFQRTPYFKENSDLPAISVEDLPQQTDADGDDELITNDEDENTPSDLPTTIKGIKAQDGSADDDEYFQATPKAESKMPPLSTSESSSHAKFPTLGKTAAGRSNAYRPDRVSTRVKHTRNVSSNTVLYDPLPGLAESSSSPSRKAITARNSAKNSGTLTPVTAGRRTPKRQSVANARARPIMPPRNLFQSAPDLAGMLMLERGRDRQSSLNMDLGSDLGDNKVVSGGLIGAVPSSFATQMAFATGAMRAKQAAVAETDDQNRMSKLMLARMNTLEEGFRDILQEFKGWRKEETRSTGDGAEVKFSKVKIKKPSKKMDKTEVQPKDAEGSAEPETGERET